MGTYISTFANGMAFMFFIGSALHLSLYGYRTRSNLFLEILFSLLAMLELKNLVPIFSDAAGSNAENISLFFDGLAVAVCGLCLFELLRSGRNAKSKVFTLLSLFTVYVALWIVSNLFPAPWLNVLFKLSCIVLWLLIVEEHNRREESNMAFDEVEEQEAVVVPHTEIRTNRDTNGMKDEMYETETDVIEEVEEAPNAEEQAFHFKKQLNKVMEDGMIYRNPRLTINEVANAVGTNRTYLSAYLNSVLHTTFYDYINGYRIEYISKKLLEEEAPGKTIEEIAELSGFNSTTTFRRAFQKKTGMTPMTFRREALKS
jgi:AraC-like DNA-binding protein/chromate transport protein ChrA